MMQRKTRWIAVMLVVLAVFAAGSLAGYDAAVAIPCCSGCDSAYFNCINGCNGDPACEDVCEMNYLRCSAICNDAC